MSYRSLPTAGRVGLGLALAPVPCAPLFASDSGGRLAGLPTLDRVELGEFHSKRFKPKRHGTYLPEPKPSKVGKVQLPKFGGDTAQPFDGFPGAIGAVPLPGLQVTH